MNNEEHFKRWLMLRRAFDFCIQYKNSNSIAVILLPGGKVISSIMPINYLKTRLKRIDAFLEELTIEEIEISEALSLLK